MAYILVGHLGDPCSNQDMIPLTVKFLSLEVTSRVFLSLIVCVALATAYPAPSTEEPLGRNKRLS